MIRWDTRIEQDRWAVAYYHDGKGRLLYKRVELKDYAYHADALRAAIDDVLRQIEEARR